MDLEYEIDGPIATIRLNRPERRNSFTIDMIDRWVEALGAAADDDDVRCVVLTSVGDHFCSGVDLETLSAVDEGALAMKMLFTNHIHRVAHTVERLDKPLIASMKGYAVGAGLDMALMCDMRFAGGSAQFSEGYIRVGLVPGDGGCYYLPRLVGPAKALEMLLTGEFVDADEALRIGLVNRLYADADVLDRTYEFAHQIASMSPVATRLIKRATYQSMRGDLATSLDLISSHIAIVRSTDDAREAMEAFRERRPARFTGR